MKRKLLKMIISIAVSCLLVGCASRAADMLNPFAEDVPEGYGDRSNKTVLQETGGGAQADKARHALQVMRDYRGAQPPQPYYPVIQPAEVRLMWVPDHINKAGDLVPAHYYYLRVLDDRWAVQDAFELESQLNAGSSGGGSATPWVHKGIQNRGSQGRQDRRR